MIVPTVDRGLRDVDFWSMETAGDSPSMKSTSGLSIWPRNWRAYADRLSTYRRWPSAKIVSKARLDLPDPDSPVKTISASRGRSSETSLRLCSRAPRMIRRSATGEVLGVWGVRLGSGCARLTGAGDKFFPSPPARAGTPLEGVPGQAVRSP